MSPRIFYLLSVLLFALPNLTFSSSHVPIEGIQFKGLRNITLEQVTPHLPLKIGQSLYLNNIDSILKTLYSSGFFESVKLLEKAGTIIIEVKERPVIKQITISEQSKLPGKLLDQLLERRNIQVGEFFSESTLEAFIKELQSFYNMQGQYQNIIKTSFTLNDNKDQVHLKIDLPPHKGTLKFAEIYFLGNKAFSQKELLAQLPITNNAWTGLLRNKILVCHPATQQKSLEALKDFYQDKGYFDAEITSKNTSITPDHKAAYWTIQVKEGPLYRIGEYKILGSHQLNADQLKSLIHFKPNQVYSKTSILKTERAFKEKLGFFSKVRIIPSINRNNATIDLTLQIDPGKPIYVRQLHIEGNHSIQDHTIRKLCLQPEAALFSTDNLKEAEVRLNKLGFAKSPVVILPIPVSNKAGDQVDLRLKIDETSSAPKLFPGTLSWGGNGLDFSSQIFIPNVLGRGIKGNIELSKKAQDYSASLLYDNPYATLHQVQHTFKFVLRSHNPSMVLLEKLKKLYQESHWVQQYSIVSENESDSVNSGNESNARDGSKTTEFLSEPITIPKEETVKSNSIELPKYNMNELGFMLKYGIPINRSHDLWTIKFEPRILELRLPGAQEGESQELSSFLNKYGKNLSQIPVTIGFNFSTRKENMPFPEKGFDNYFKLTLASLWAKEWYWYPYCKFDLTGAFYHTARVSISQEISMALKWKMGYGFSLRENDIGLPFFENYHSGQMRGFAFNSLGDKDSLGHQLGGNCMFNASAILAAPKPLRGDHFRVSLFCDIGALETAKSIQEFISVSSPKLSVGVALDILVPLPIVGTQPLNFNIAKPIWSKAEDKKQPFSYTIGSSFL